MSTTCALPYLPHEIDLMSDAARLFATLDLAFNHGQQEGLESASEEIRSLEQDRRDLESEIYQLEREIEDLRGEIEELAAILAMEAA